MTPARRWCLVALGAVLIVSAPVVVDARPAADSDVTAVELLARIRASDGVAYSGYVEASGGLTLPSTDEFESVADLFGGPSRLRVWWRDGASWRVDRLSTSGETDLFHADDVTTTWDYERLRTTATLDSLVFLPRSVDLLPARLASLVLAEARPDEVSRLPAERVAGRDAPGLRLTPSMPQSSIDRVDIWADAATGLPLRVAVYGTDDDSPPVDTTLAEVTFERPPAETVAFDPPPGSQVSFGGLGSDSLISHIPDVYVSSALAGLPSTDGDGPRLFSRYGRGVTQLLVLALDDEVADPLREQLAASPGVVADGRGSALGAGPVHLRLSPCLGDEPSWLLVGTVDDQTLRRAAGEIYAPAAAPTDGA